MILIFTFLIISVRDLQCFSVKAKKFCFKILNGRVNYRKRRAFERVELGAWLCGDHVENP